MGGTAMLHFRVEQIEYGRWQLTDGDAVRVIDADLDQDWGKHALITAVRAMMGTTDAVVEQLAAMLTALEGGAMSFGPSVAELRALAAGMERWHFKHTAIRTSGQVIELRPDMQDNDITYRAVFRFADETGKEHTVTSSHNSKPATHRVGDQVTVLYPPGHPEAANIDSFWELWFMPAIFGFLAAAFGIWLFFAMRGHPHPQAASPARFPS